MERDSSFAHQVVERSGQNIRLCYQCGKCFSGCTVADFVDHGPNAIIRMIQYGERDRVLSSHMIWLCVSCMTCGVRCPNEIAMSQVFDTLREMSIESGMAYSAQKKVVVLHEEFVRNVRIWGRLHEATFFMPYMLRTLDFFSNMGSGVALMTRGKLPLIPKRIKGAKDIRRLFEKSYKTKGQLAEDD